MKKMNTEAMVREIVDRDAIREVIHRFDIGCDRDLDLVASCFTPDGYMESPLFVGKIKESIPAIREALERFESTMHMTGTQIIELNGDKANAETYSIHYHRLKGKQKDFISAFRYLDDLVRQGEKWLIQRRVCKLVWQREDTVILSTLI